MSTSFLSFNPYQNFNFQQASGTSDAQASMPQPPSQPTPSSSSSAAAQDDSVKLSETAQAKLLHQQGQSVSAIAASLGTSTKAIDEDLGITLSEAMQKTLEETTTAASS